MKTRFIQISSIILLLFCTAFPLSASEYMELDGPWDFYWNTFISPQDFLNGTAPDPITQVVVPTLWNDMNIDERGDKGKGSATYHLKVTDLDPNESYGIFMFYRAGTALNLYANGVLVSTQGVPSEDYKGTIANREMNIAVFTPDEQGSVDFVMHCSNNLYRKGGVWTALKLGTEKVVRQEYAQSLNRSFLFSGALFIVILYHLSLFFFRRTDKYNLYLSIATFFLLLRILTVGFSLVRVYIPEFPFSLDLKFEFLSICATPLFFVLYVQDLFKEKAKNLFSKIVLLIGLLLIIAFVLVPVEISNYLVPISEIYMIIAGLYAVYILLVHLKTMSLEIAILTILSFVILILGAIHDVLVLQLIPIFLQNTMILPYSFIGFVLLMSIITAWQHEKAIKDIFALTENLKNTNAAYYRFVPQQFLELIRKNNIIDVELGDWTSKNITMLCADIRNFTALSEFLSGKEIFDLLNMYLIRIAPIIRKYGGFIEKYLGDGIIALFPDNSKEVFACAIEMQNEMKLLRACLASNGNPELVIGIGVHYGNVILGTVGADRRMNEITLSKAVETVTMLESLTKVYQKEILVSGDSIVALGAEEEYTFRKMDISRLKIAGNLGVEVFSLQD